MATCVTSLDFWKSVEGSFRPLVPAFLFPGSTGEISSMVVATSTDPTAEVYYVPFLHRFGPRLGEDLTPFKEFFEGREFILCQGGHVHAFLRERWGIKLKVGGDPLQAMTVLADSAGQSPPFHFPFREMCMRYLGISSAELIESFFEGEDVWIEDSSSEDPNLLALLDREVRLLCSLERSLISRLRQGLGIVDWLEEEYRAVLALDSVFSSLTRVGYPFDVTKAYSDSLQVTHELGVLEEKIQAHFPSRVKLNSSRQLANALYLSTGLNLETHRRTPMGALSTSYEALSELRDKHPVIPLLLRYKEETEKSRCLRLLLSRVSGSLLHVGWVSRAVFRPKEIRVGWRGNPFGCLAYLKPYGGMRWVGVGYRNTIFKSVAAKTGNTLLQEVFQQPSPFEYLGSKLGVSRRQALEAAWRLFHTNPQRLVGREVPPEFVDLVGKSSSYTVRDGPIRRAIVALEKLSAELSWGSELASSYFPANEVLFFQVPQEWGEEKVKGWTQESLVVEWGGVSHVPNVEDFPTLLMDPSTVDEDFRLPTGEAEEGNREPDEGQLGS